MCIPSALRSFGWANHRDVTAHEALEKQKNIEPAAKALNGHSPGLKTSKSPAVDFLSSLRDFNSG